MNENKRIGISGGTFDPVHLGHLLMAELAREKFGLDKVLFIPSGTPPHKSDREVTDAEHRFNMVKEAVESNPFFEASRIEIDRTGYTYTIDTLMVLKELYGESTQLFFITGADVVADLLNWRQPEKVMELCHFIAILRPGYERQEFLEQIKFLRNRYMAEIHIMDAPLLQISSTAIRERVKNGMTIRYFVPESVKGYIFRNNIYR